MAPDLARLTEEERAIAARLGPRVCPLDGHVSREDLGRGGSSADLAMLLTRLALARAVVEAARPDPLDTWETCRHNMKTVVFDDMYFRCGNCLLEWSKRVQAALATHDAAVRPEAKE